MAFNINRWVRQTLAFNAGQITTSFNPSETPALSNGPALFSYASASDNIAAIGGADYFVEVINDLHVNDLILAVGSDASLIYQVATVDLDAGTITVSSFTPAGSVGTANIQDLAVTTAKLADDAVTTAKIDDAAVTSAKLAEGLVQHSQVDVSLANFIGSYTASVELVAAPGAGKKLILHRAVLAINYGGTVLADGGASHIQYADTANGAGTKATGTLAAATLIAATADTTFGFSPVDTTLVDSATLNEGLYFAMATADFTGGTDSTYKIDVWYSVVDLA